MAKERAYITNLKIFTRGEITSDDLPALEAELYGTNDRAATLMLGAIVENSLRHLLLSMIRPDLNSDDRKVLFTSDGPFGTFAAKTALAYAMGGIGPITRHDLDHIRLIRNEFAHSRRSFTFAQREVATVCAHLKFPDRDDSSVPIELIKALSPENLHSSRFKKNAKVRFVMSCHTICINILSNLHSISQPSSDNQLTP